MQDLSSHDSPEKQKHGLRGMKKLLYLRQHLTYVSLLTASGKLCGQFRSFKNVVRPGTNGAMWITAVRGTLCQKVLIVVLRNLKAIVTSKHYGNRFVKNYYSVYAFQTNQFSTFDVRYFLWCINQNLTHHHWVMPPLQFV